MAATVVANALRDVQRYFEALPDVTLEAAFLAINDTARDSVVTLRRAMTSQVNFPRGYLNTDKLGIKRKANRINLEAVIAGRDRPTSLARFAPGATPENSRRRPIRVKVSKGGSGVVFNSDRRKASAFLLRLKNGNIGLAIRLKPGERLQNSDKAVRLQDNVYLLYGPSVDQVMQGVSEDLAPEIQETVASKFFRQFARLSTRG